MPGVDFTSIAPPCCRTIPYAMARPSPLLPRRPRLKKGSNSRSRVSASIPVPVSETVSATYGPGLSPGWV